MTEGPIDPAVNLVTYVETRLNLLKEEFKTLKLTIDERLKDMDLRYEQRFEAQQMAILKSETATKEKLESMNEFRKTLGDQATTLMPRTEANGQFTSLTEKINRLEKGADLREGQIAGVRERIQESKSTTGVWIAITSAIIGVVALAIKFYK